MRIGEDYDDSADVKQAEDNTYGFWEWFVWFWAKYRTVLNMKHVRSYSGDNGDSDSGENDERVCDDNLSLKGRQKCNKNKYSKLTLSRGKWARGSRVIPFCVPALASF